MLQNSDLNGCLTQTAAGYLIRASRPLPLLSPPTVSVSNGQDTCRSVPNHGERPLTHITISARCRCGQSFFEKRMFNND
jgi:hypothetical protein